MNFDDKLREMAKDDHIPLPDGYDEMLTGLYNSLAAPGQEEASHGKEAFPVKTHAFRLTRLLAAVAVIALMIASMAVGALAFSQDTIVEIPVEVEVPVEVPVEQETIVMEELGLTLVLPDSWKGRYEVIEDTFEPYHSPMWEICVKYVYDAQVPADESGEVLYRGTLFYVFQCADYAMTAEEFETEGIAGISRYLLATKDATYAIMYATDVQFDCTDAYAQEEYNSMASEMKDIGVMLDGVFGTE